jgi:hypothetical protein
MKKHLPKNSRLDIRLPSEDLDRLRKHARRKGQTMTQFVLHRLRNEPVPDLRWQRQLHAVLRDVAREINHVGNNINQVTMHLHILRRRRGETPVPVMEEFNRLFRTYMESIESLCRRLDEIRRT